MNNTRDKDIKNVGLKPNLQTKKEYKADVVKTISAFCVLRHLIRII